MFSDQILNVKQKLKGPILIIGHTGFKGTWLSLLFEKIGIEVIGLSLPPDKDSLYFKLKRKNKIEEFFQDIRNYSATERIIKGINPHHVFHLAAQPLVLNSYERPRETFETNIIGTANILDALFKVSDCKKVVVATTDKVYKNDEKNVYFTENSCLGGKDPYSWSKVGTEAAVGAWRQISKINGGPEVISVRSGNVIGGGDLAANRLLPDLIRAFIFDSKMIIRNPKSSRPWQHVLDPLQGYILAMTTKTDCSAFNFSPEGKSLSVAEVANIAIEAWGAKIQIEIENYDNDSESKSLGLNSRLAKDNLNWINHWSQEKAVKSTVNWWKSISENRLSYMEACDFNLGELIGK